MVDLAVRQRPLQFGNTRSGDPGAAEQEHPQPGHPLEMRQPRIADLGAAEQKRLQAGQFTDMYQPCAGDPGTAEKKLLQVGQPCQVRQPRVRDPGAVEAQILQLRQPPKMYQSRVGDPGVPDVNPLQVRHALQVPQPCIRDRGPETEVLQFAQLLDVQQGRVGDLRAAEVDSKSAALFIPSDPGSQCFQRGHVISFSRLTRRLVGLRPSGLWRGTVTTPGDPDQQQTQKIFHVRLRMHSACSLRRRPLRKV